MLISVNLQRLSLNCLLALTFFLGTTTVSPLLAQTILEEAEEEFPAENAELENDIPPVDSDLLLSLDGGERLMSEALTALDEQNYDLAVRKLQQARQIFNQLTNFYQQLANSFSGIDQPLSQAQKNSALNAAQQRDTATYRLALVHRSNNQPELAVPLLIQIVRSQNPTSKLGGDAYQQLFELGFATISYPSEALGEGSELRPLTQSDSLLSLPGARKLMSEATAASESENYPVAIKKLKQARQIFNQLTNFYQQLSGSFSGISNEVADIHKRNAFEAAQSRDEATYKLALAHKGGDQAELAVPLFIQIVRSQNPTSELGRQAYQQLFDMGFVDLPYQRPSANSNGDQSSLVQNLEVGVRSLEREE